MKSYFKALSANTRDMRTGIFFQVQSGTKTKSYIFNVPDGFNRLNITKSKIFQVGTAETIFISSLKPDYFGGYPSFLLTHKLKHNTHEGKNYGQSSLIGPEGIRDRIIASRYFMGHLIDDLRVVEMTQDVAKSEQP